MQGAADADPTHAEIIITSAGMSVRKTTKPKKSDFAAYQGDTSGLALLLVKAVSRRACYHWEWSVDQINWTGVPSTLQANTSIDGLKPGVVHYFRFRTTTKFGQSDWSQVVSLLVK